MTRQGQNPSIGGGYRYYLLGLCCVSYFLAYVDRHVFSTLVTPIKAEFGLSDATLGLLSGMAFGLTYSLFSVPMGALADRRSRKAILAGSIVVWSMMTGLCGLAKSATVLALARLGVGAGEAGVTPSAVSTISDLFPPETRGRAIACYPICGTLGAAAALPIGAWIATYYGWRSVFLFLFVPGIVLAALIWLTFREVPRTASEDGDDRPLPLGQTLLHICRQRHLMLVFSACGLMSMLTSIAHWLPAFYQRSHGASLMEVGSWLGIALAITGPLGMFAGGWLSDRLGRGGTTRVLYLLASITALEILFSAIMLFVPSFALSVFFAGVWNMVTVAYAAPCFALGQNLVPPRMRATSMGVLNVFNNVVGYGLGPVVTGAISTGLSGGAGAESLRWSLLVLGGGIALLPAGLFVLAALAYRRHAARHGEGPMAAPRA